MSRSRRKKKHRPTKWDAEENQRVRFSEAGQYHQSVDTPGPPPFGPTGPPGQLPAGLPASTVRRSEQHGASREYAKFTPREVPVLGAGESDTAVLFTVPEDFVRDLIRQGKLTLGPKITKNLHALRIVPPPPPVSDHAISLHNRGVGDPTARSTRDNVRGCWSIESPFGKEPMHFRNFRAIPPKLQKIFRQVVLDCLSKPNVGSPAAA